MIATPTTHRSRLGLILCKCYGLEWAVIETLEAGFDPNVQGGEYGSALGAASSIGHDKQASHLVEHGANTRLRGSMYRTPLYYTVLYSWDNRVKSLVGAGVDVISDSEKMTTLHYIDWAECGSIAETLLEADFPMDS